MRLGGRPVFLVAANTDAGQFRAGAITSLVSVDVEEGQEEVAFVLALNSELLRYLNVGSALSVSLLGESQSDEARYFSSAGRPNDVIAGRDGWCLKSGTPVFSGAVATLIGAVATQTPRLRNCLIIATIAEVEILSLESPLIYEDGNFRGAETMAT